MILQREVSAGSLSSGILWCPLSKTCEADEESLRATAKALFADTGMPPTGAADKESPLIYVGQHPYPGEERRVCHDFAVKVDPGQAFLATAGINPKGWTELDFRTKTNSEAFPDDEWTHEGKHRLQAAWEALEKSSTSEGSLVPVDEQSRQIVPAGGLLRALLQGGERAIRAIDTLHRRYYHSSSAVLKRLLRAAGITEEIVNATDDVVAKCKVCRTWALPDVAPVAKSDQALDFGHVVFGDLFFYNRLQKDETSPGDSPSPG